MKKILILFVSALLAVSCSGFLEEQVYSQHTPDNAYNTPEGANKALAACYSWLRHSFDNKWSAGFGELGTDEATSYNDSYGDHESQLDDYTYTAEYDWIDAVYGSCYGGIKCCNIVIDLVPNTMEGYDLMVAQAKFLQPYIGKEVTFGIRPEDVEFSHTPIDGKTINGHVSVVEPLGSETQVYVSTSKAKVVGKIDPTVIPEPDEKVALIANMEKAKFFDLDTELTIR